MSAVPWPTKITLSKDGKTLCVTFEEGEPAMLGAEMLRVESPSAEVQGHGEGQKRTPSGKRGVGITKVWPVGNYAVRLVFDDGHDTGIYSWAILHDFALRQEEIMRDYRARLEELGLARE